MWADPKAIRFLLDLLLLYPGLQGEVLATHSEILDREFRSPWFWEKDVIIEFLNFLKAFAGLG